MQARTKTHVIGWDADAEDEDDRTWVKGLRKNQCVDLTVWAEFPGWTNHVASASMEIVTRKESHLR